MVLGCKISMIEKLLLSLCQDLSLRMPIKTKNASYSLDLNENITVIFKDSSSGISIKSSLKPIPIKKREDCLIYLMRANLLGQGTGGFRIGLDEDEKTLTLQGGLPYEINYKPFKDKIEEFVNFVAYWQEEISKYSST